MAQDVETNTSKPRRIATPLPLLSQVIYFFRLVSFQAMVNAFVFYQTRIARLPPSKRPTYTKSYPVRPSIVNHVFIPPSYKSGSAPLPLIIDVHGGGFAVGHPTVDDGDNVILSYQHGFVVVSIGYSLSPFNPYPTAVHDVAALVNAVLEDPDLPIDKSQVALLGYSAGANLALAAAQVDGLAERLRAAISIYVPTDMTRTMQMNLLTATPPPGKKDMLLNIAGMVNWGYIRPSQNLEDPLLSPIFAKREALPKHLYFIGCQYDLLCRQAEDMAAKMADSEGGERKVLEDKEGKSWEQGGVRWRNIQEVEHGFNQMLHSVSGEKRKMWERKTDDMHATIAAWLRERAFSG